MTKEYISTVFDIAASIVTYNNEPEIVNQAVKSFLSTPLSIHLLIIDNSDSDSLRSRLIEDNRISYIYNKENTGFGKAHNQAIDFFKGRTKYILILNPDVYFDNSVLLKLYNSLQADKKIGIIAPRVLYPNGEEQTSRRLLPSPLDLLIRRFPYLKHAFPERLDYTQYRDVSSEQIIEVPFLLGCFLLIRMEALQKLGSFDERYFVYMEDLDLCRRFFGKYKVVYYGKVHIYHLYQRASSKSLKMLLLHTVSMVKYFNKWGWFNDNKKDKINHFAIELKKLKEPLDKKSPNEHDNEFVKILT